jgi:TonB family protein
MIRCPRPRVAVRSLYVALALLIPANALSQLPDSVLSKLDEGYLDSLASHASKKIREANPDEKEPKVLVIDFFRSSPGTSSRLGTLLADRFSESLTAYATGLKILDRKILKDYLTQNWTTLEDLQSNDVCLAIARQMGATGVIIGTLSEEKGQLSLTIRLGGFGLRAKGKDIYLVSQEKAIFPFTDAKRNLFLQPGPNFARTADDIPADPGVVTFNPKNSASVKMPRCANCQSPDYVDAARAVKFQGTVLLSVVITEQGRVTSIYVLKGAPFGLTAKAIEAVQHWSLRPGEIDGKPSAIRIQVEVTFRLY